MNKMSLVKRYTKASSQNLIANLINKIFLFISSAITAHLLGAEIFGSYSLLLSTIATFQTFAALGLGIAATKYLAERKRTDPVFCGRVHTLSLIIATSLGLIMAATYIIWGSHLIIGAAVAHPTLMILFALTILTNAIQSVSQGVLMGLEDYPRITRLNLATGVVMLSSIGTGTYFFHLPGAIAGMTIAQLVSTGFALFLSQQSLQTHGIPRWERPNWRDARIILGFAIPSALGGILYVPAVMAMQYLVANAPGGLTDLGTYTVGSQILGILLFLPTVLGSSLTPIIAEHWDENRSGVMHLLGRATWINTLLATSIALAAIPCTPLILTIFGKSFVGGWWIIVTCIITVIPLASFTPINRLLSASNHPWWAAGNNAVNAGIMVLGAILLLPLGGFGLALARLAAHTGDGIYTFIIVRWIILKKHDTPPGAIIVTP
jgi:O-antigen/teichoic acid export membrane protein